MGSNASRGMIRGLTADLVGGPVDLATDVTNLGVAGSGYLAHKLGLIKTPWDLIDKKDVPLSSDWHAKNTPLEEKEGEGEGYDKARLGANALTMALRGMGRTPTRDSTPAPGSPEAQRGALYLKNGQPQGEDLAMYHSTEGIMGLPSKYAMKQTPKPPLKELTHPSFAITSDRGNFEPAMNAFGGNILIPHPNALDPKRTPTVIKAHDFYTPRHGMSSEAKTRKIYDESGLPQEPHYLASARLEDKFGRRYPKGGTGAEANGLQFLEPSGMSMGTTPRFQNYEHFEKSPKGAARLRQYDPDNPPELLRNNYDVLTDEDMSRIAQLKGLDPERHGVQLANQVQSRALDPSYWKGVKGVDPEEIKGIIERLREHKKGLIDYSPSDYAEVKRYGPMGLNKDNILAYIADTSDNDREYNLAKKVLGKKGIDIYRTEEFSDPREMHSVIAGLQTQALRRKGR